MGSGGHHLSACKYRPSPIDTHDDVAFTASRVISLNGNASKHESQARVNVAASSGTTHTPDFVVNERVGFDVTLTRPTDPTGPVTTSPCAASNAAYKAKLEHYYGDRNGAALCAASSCALDAIKKLFYSNTDASDRAIATWFEDPEANRVPPRLADVAASPWPAKPVRPIVINGASGAIEGRSRRSLRAILSAGMPTRFTRKQIADKLHYALSSISLACIRTEARRRLTNIHN